MFQRPRPIESFNDFEDDFDIRRALDLDSRME
jgi:hypothetical protein